MKATSTICISLLLALSLLSCASGYSSGATDYSADLAEMKERILELQEQATVADVEIERLRQQVAELERRLAGGAGSGAAADREAEVSSTEHSGTLTSGRPDPVISTEVEESDLEAPGGAETVAAGATLTAPPESGPAAPEPSEDLAPQIVEPTPRANLEPVDAAGQALYDRGYTLYHQGRYLDAEASFQRFLQSHPSTELSDNAQFWIGESRYARGDIRGALAAFRETLQRFPEGNKVPDALIKEGDCLTSLGDRDGARSRYDEVIRRFPSSAAAIMAEERLAGLD